MSSPAIKPGEYIILAADGTETLVHEKPRLEKIYKEIGCDCIDTVVLTKKRDRAEVIMQVDDTGMIDGKPVNAFATEIYHSICKLGTLWQIHGDVVLCNDRDFEGNNSNPYP